MRPVGILSMLYFAKNARFYQRFLSKKNNTEGADDLEAHPVSLVRALWAIAPGRGIARGSGALLPVKS